MLKIASRLNWFGSRVAAGASIAAVSGLAVGFLLTNSAIAQGDFRDFALYTLVTASIAIVIGGPFACAALCLVLRNVDPWEAWPALTLATVASTFVALGFPLYLGPFTFAFTALAGGLTATIVVRLFARP
jgi:hypothetical protein